MKSLGYIYDVSTEIEFTFEEIQQLVKISGQHYDSKCKEASQHGGFIYGLSIRCPRVEPCTVSRNFTIRELDLLCKITEMYAEPNDLHWPIKQLLVRALAEREDIQTRRDLREELNRVDQSQAGS